MKETRSKVQISDTETRYLTRVFSDPVAENTHEAYQAQFQFLADLGFHRQISLCGDGPFQRMRMFHDGTCWVAEFEAVRGPPK